MGYAEVIREALVLEKLNRFLERNHVPIHRNVFFNGTFLCLVEIQGSNSRFRGVSARVNG